MPDAPITACGDCGRSLGTLRQEGLPGIPRHDRCPDCKTKARTKLMLGVCPEEGEAGWEALTEWEQEFLPSVRQQFERRGTISEAQFQALERIYGKV